MIFQTLLNYSTTEQRPGGAGHVTLLMEWSGGYCVHQGYGVLLSYQRKGPGRH